MMIRNIILLCCSVSLLFASLFEAEPEKIQSKVLYAKYKSYPHIVYTKQRFKVKIETNILLPQDQFFRLETKLQKHTNLELLTEDTFDVVILDGQIDDLTMANVNRVLEEKEGVFVCTTAMYQKDSEKMVGDLKTVGDNFWISMPYQFGHTVAILASKKYHPQADIILDRSDFLDTQYYYTELQNAAFVLPSYIQKAITGIARR
jgi:hypothetical protein